MDQTVVYRGAGCISSHPEAFLWGSKCLIVTGRRSAVVSGALQDVTSVLNDRGIAFTVYNGITENPLFDHCREAGRLGNEFGAKFVIGIGGGSPLDAAKAAAVFAVTPDLSADELFDPAVNKPALPLVAVPLTAGTGSEVNRYSVITYDERKKSFSSEATLPRAAFLDPTYLRTLNADYTVSTAIDAFCHCLESFLSPKSTEESEAEALRGAALLWKALTENDFHPDNADAAGLSEETRMAMLDGAACGGRAIKVTGTGFPHPLGYGLTLCYDIPHGRACGAFVGTYIAYNAETPEGKRRLTTFAAHLGTTPEMIAAVIPALADVNLILHDKVIEDMVAKVSGNKNYRNAPRPLTDEDAVDILSDLFGNG